MTVAVLLGVPLQEAKSGSTYTYDALGRVISVRQDDGKQSVYVYDSAGNRVQTIVSATTQNRAPVAVPDQVTLFENQTSINIDPTLNDTDPDGSPLALFSVSEGNVGTVARSGNTISYGSSFHRNGQDNIIYTITDGQGMSASGRVTVTLANLSPTAAADSIQSPANVGRTFDPTANDSDPGSDPLRVTTVTPPAHGTATLTQSGTGIMYLPVTNYTGADAFSYVVSDGDGGTAIGTVSVDVVSTVPPPPTATADQVVLQGNAAGGDSAVLIYDPRPNDLDPLGRWLRIVAVSQPVGGIVDIIDNGTRLRITSIAGTPASASVGPFTYVVEDGIGRQASATISSTINWN